MTAKRVARFWIVLTLLGGCAGIVSPASGKATPVLTKVGMIHELKTAEAERRCRVRVRAVVTYTDAPSDMLFVQDETGGVYVDITPPHRYQLKSGQEVEVEGVTAPGYFAPMVVEPQIRVVGDGRLPLPERAPIQALFAGGEDCQWVETRGVVRSALVSDGVLRMSLAEGNARIAINVSGCATGLSLVDSVITVRGVSGGVFNDKGQLTGAELYVPGPEHIQVDEPGPADPFSIEIRPVQRILQFVPIRGYGHRVRIRGTVTFCRAGLCLFLRDDSASIYITIGPGDPLKEGDVVEAVGFPEVGDYTPILRDVVYRRVGSSVVPAPRKVVPALALKGAYDTELVEIEGRLLGSAFIMGEQVLALQSGYLTFNAHLNQDEGARTISLAPGSLLRLTGICSVQADELRRPKSFRVLLRGPSDILVLESPSWWTLGRILTVIGVLVAAVIAVLAWVFVLDRRIKAQTADIRQRLEREAALEHELQRAQKLEAIGRLAGGIAHDFNNLLTAILGYAELIALQLPKHHPMLDDLREIKKAGERATSLTRQLLAFSRRQVLQTRVLDLNAVIQEISKMLDRLIGENIELVSVLDRHLGRVKADPSQIEQVLMNLAVNARDAMPDGGKLTIETCNADLGELDVQGKVELQPGAYVRLTVSDTGCGIDEATQKKIFEPFFTTKGTGQGTGLGLATVYGIVKQSGGDIVVESDVGRGTIFAIYLPQVAAAAEQEPVHDAPAAARGRETILVVEDEDALRDLVRVVLNRHGYAVFEARNGEEAVALASRSSSRIDLLVSDVVMPKMGGFELAQRLSPLRPEMKVLFVSGYTDDDVASLCSFKEGMPFLQKPFTPDALALKVREVLDGSAQDRDPAPAHHAGAGTRTSIVPAS